MCLAIGRRYGFLVFFTVAAASAARAAITEHGLGGSPAHVDFARTVARRRTPKAASATTTAGTAPPPTPQPAPVAASPEAGPGEVDDGDDDDEDEW